MSCSKTSWLAKENLMIMHLLHVVPTAGRMNPFTVNIMSSFLFICRKWILQSFIVSTGHVDAFFPLNVLLLVTFH